MVTIASQMGAGTFYDYMNAFGFGHLTGVDLEGEVSGRLKVPGDSDWYPVDLGTNSFGQGVTATPMQIMMAVSSIANGGRMVMPHALYAMVRDGRHIMSLRNLQVHPSLKQQQTLSLKCSPFPWRRKPHLLSYPVTALQAKQALPNSSGRFL